MDNTFNPESVKEVKSAFWSNHATLKEMEKSGEEDVDQSFEQGYENGIKFVCETLGIDLEPDESDDESLADAWLRTHNKE